MDTSLISPQYQQKTFSFLYAALILVLFYQEKRTETLIVKQKFNLSPPPSAQRKFAVFFSYALYFVSFLLNKQPFQHRPHRKSVKKVFLERKPFGEIGGTPKTKNLQSIFRSRYFYKAQSIKQKQNPYLQSPLLRRGARGEVSLVERGKGRGVFYRGQGRGAKKNSSTLKCRC